jgi:hypothetical protein
MIIHVVAAFTLYEAEVGSAGKIREFEAATTSDRRIGTLRSDNGGE